MYLVPSTAAALTFLVHIEPTGSCATSTCVRSDVGGEAGCDGEERKEVREGPSGL